MMAVLLDCTAEDSNTLTKVQLILHYMYIGNSGIGCFVNRNHATSDPMNIHVHVGSNTKHFKIRIRIELINLLSYLIVKILIIQ